MAEAAGLAVGVVALVASFQTCLTTYDQIVKLRHKNDDLKYFLNMVTFEQLKLSMLMPDLITPQPDFLGSLIHDSLDTIGKILAELYDLLYRHAGTSLAHDTTPMKGRAVRKPGNRIVRAATWVGGDGPRIETLINRLANLNERLSSLVPKAQHASLQLGFIARSVATSSTSELRDIQVAAQGHHYSVALAADVKASRIEEFAGTTNVSGIEFTSRRILDLNAFKWILPASSLRSKMRDAQMASTRNIEIDLATAIDEPRVLGRYLANSTAKEPGTSIPVLVEWREGFRSTKSHSDHQYRLDQLTHVLRQMSSESSSTTDNKHNNLEVTDTTQSESTNPPGDLKSTISFGILPCLGWLVPDNSFSRVGLIFRLPQDDLEVPMSLHDRILRDRGMRTDGPLLGTRFTMALGLAQRLANLIILGWVHKSIRSHNVIVIDSTSSEKTSSNIDNTITSNLNSLTLQTDKKPQKKHYRTNYSLYLTGFSYAKPTTNTQSEDGNKADLSVLPTNSVDYILYRPPSHLTIKHNLNEAGDRVDSMTGMTHLDATFDIYALGIILLEIGLWRTIRSLYDGVRRWQQRQAQSQKSETKASHLSADEFLGSEHLQNLVEMLGVRTGGIYQSVVKRCLNLEEVEGGSGQSGTGDGTDILGVEDDDKGSFGRDYAQFLQDIVRDLSSCRA